MEYSHIGDDGIQAPQLPPQSTPVSVPFFTPSEHVATTIGSQDHDTYVHSAAIFPAGGSLSIHLNVTDPVYPGVVLFSVTVGLLHTG